MNCSPPGSFVHGVLQATILEWVAIPLSREFSQPRDQSQVYRIARVLYHLSHQGSHLCTPHHLTPLSGILAALRTAIKY